MSTKTSKDTSRNTLSGYVHANGPTFDLVMNCFANNIT